MSNRKVSSFTVRFFWPLMLCLGLGLGLMALVGLMSYRSDLHLASQNLTDATQYVKQQRTAYDRFNDTSVTKSLLRVIENAQQIDREIQYKIALTGEATLNTDDLRRYTYEQRLTGIILMNEHGVVQREYSTDGLDYAALRGLFGKLLAEVQRIKSEGDFQSARDLVENYGVKVDPELHKEILARYEKLRLSPYKGFINPVYTPVRDAEGNITDVKISYDEAYDHQMLRYSRDYNTLPDINE